MAKLVVYDSQYGNTKKIAEEIAGVIGAKAVRVQDFSPGMLQGISHLVVGCPVHAWRLSRPAAEFLSSFPPGSLKGVKVAAFDTRIKGFLSGSASDKVEKQLVNLGGDPVVSPGKFIVKGSEGPLEEGELENAKHWARHILENTSV